jgi:hypothetical protein
MRKKASENFRSDTECTNSKLNMIRNEDTFEQIIICFVNREAYFCKLQRNEICSLLGYYAGLSDNSVPTFRNSLSVRSWKYKQQLLHILLSVIQHAKRMHVIVLSSEAWLALACLCTLSHKRRDFRKKVIEHKMRVLILFTSLSETLLTLRRIQPCVILNTHSSWCKIPVILFRF